MEIGSTPIEVDYLYMYSQLSRNRATGYDRGSPPLVLIIEYDDDDYRVIYNSFQRSATVPRLHRCPTGSQALDYLDRAVRERTSGSNIPALILLDLNVPDIDGGQVLQSIKEDPILHFIPTVILTRSDRPKDIQKCYELGVGGYILKSIDLTQFEDSMVVVSEFWLNRAVLPEFAAILPK
jgi:CheY-like chemotaxis protein